MVDGGGKNIENISFGSLSYLGCDIGRLQEVGWEVLYFLGRGGRAGRELNV